MESTDKTRGQKCEDERCNTPDLAVHYCVDCDSSYCNGCWGFQAPHRPGKVGRDGIEHEKTNYRMYAVYKDILFPPKSKAQLRQMHVEDTSTLWFGVTKDETGDVKFEDHARYASLMANSPSSSIAENTKYPQLVSFIGVTNAGKSTLIKMLIKRATSSETSKIRYPSPVVGAESHDKTPTSGDVHLYADPQTYETQLPMLYADCEGLEGGENLPYGSQSRKRSGSPAESSKSRMGPPPKIHVKGRSRHVAWATNEHARRREYAVTELYPRLLYTFSDVVVFVLRNAKTFQSSVLTKLLRWGDAALEKSVNQPTLPHAIVCINATDMGINPRGWDPREATAQLLATLNNSFDQFRGIPEIKDLAAKWNERGIPINSVLGLIRRYYATFNVVQIPVKGRYTLMDQQISKLQLLIQNACGDSHRSKKRDRLLSNADELNVYLQAAFDHFTNKLDEPFNFVEVSLRNNPLPETVADHILQLAISIQAKRPGDPMNTGNWMFERLGEMVASCILLDCVQNRKGQPDELFERYQDYLEDALEEFGDIYWPCAYTNKKSQRCVNVRKSHSAKGHQNDKGRIIGAGPYISNFFADGHTEKWSHSVRMRLAKLQKELRRRYDLSNGEITDLGTARALHKEGLSRFFSNIGGAHCYVSHTTCFCCLREVPRHALPCGHVLCPACIKAYSSGRSEGYVTLGACPLHYDDAFTEPWRIWLKPDYAGVRVLALDGGGIRGIIELESLKAIEEELGGALPLQAFFDLIVGTSTGGIIALAMGINQWSIEKCIDSFIGLCNEAFVEREFAGIPGLTGIAPFEFATTFWHGSKYKTSVLKSKLRSSFGTDMLFGGVRQQNLEYPLNVAVTSTSGTGKEPIVLSNYSRSSAGVEQYRFIRESRPELELLVWEAAAATSAAPKYFKPYYHEPTANEFWDGGLYYNNPVHVANRERKNLWPDVADARPDLLLSIGTGRTANSISDEVDKSKSRSPKANKSTAMSEHGRPDSSGTAQRHRVWRTFQALYHRFDNVLDSELMWADFRETLPQNDWPHTQPLPYIRINPYLDYDPPKLDDKASLNRIRLDARRELKRPAAVRESQRIAYQLIASSFYFARTGPITTSNECAVFSGWIRCKFADESQNLRNLGKLLQLQRRGLFRPYFVYYEEFDDSRARKEPLSNQRIDGMVEKAVFDPIPIRNYINNESVRIHMALRLKGDDILGEKNYSLSGFPRRFSAEDSQTLIKQQSNDASKMNRRSPTEIIPEIGHVSEDSLVDSTDARRSASSLGSSPSQATHATTPASSTVEIGLPRVHNEERLLHRRWSST